MRLSSTATSKSLRRPRLRQRRRRNRKAGGHGEHWQILKLPIDDLLPAIAESLRKYPNLVIEAPPGAGKTTRVPPALLSVVRVQVLFLEPPRLAARLAARRFVHEFGECVDETAGKQL